ncbi:MAG: magnesium and cobalt exporter, family [Thermoplasmata archaeon]|jgi:CBS domain containing-hemolysin-like protein|nr:magnesium and cobalt exporter, family [Thermoplasmata archaeon]
MAVPPAVIPEAVGLLALFALSAFFSMSETAMIGVNRHQVRQRAAAGSGRAKRLDAMLDDPERILSTVLVGNTMVNITAAAVGTHVAAQLFTRFADIIGTVAVTLCVLILCELVPKTLAVQAPLPFALNLARPLRVAESILRPVIAVSAGVAKAIVRPFGLKAKGKAPYITSDEIEMLVRIGVEGGQVEKFEQRVISELFQFTETSAARVMTPAASTHFLPRGATLADATRLANQERRSRILVADGDFDHVLGFVHIKDLLRYSDADLARLPVTSALRPVLITQAATRADVLLGRMQREHRSLAVVQDLQGINVGIVTADDLLEELVGEIHDEFDAARQDHRHEAPGA